MTAQSPGHWRERRNAAAPATGMRSSTSLTEPPARRGTVRGSVLLGGLARSCPPGQHGPPQLEGAPRLGALFPGSGLGVENRGRDAPAGPPPGLGQTASGAPSKGAALIPKNRCDRQPLDSSANHGMPVLAVPSAPLLRGHACVCAQEGSPPACLRSHECSEAPDGRGALCVTAEKMELTR